MIAFVLVMFMMMVVACGMAVDFIRHEGARADLQNALDRGVLAAAALSQSYVDERIAADPDLSPDEETRQAEYARLIKAYMASRSFPAEVDLTVDLTENVNGRTIEASAEYDMATFFLRIPGMPQMRVPARASAQQIAQDVEISLVLDVSGSMYNPGNKITYEADDGTLSDRLRIEVLKIEAARFAEYMLSLDPSPDKSKTTISVVPYSHQVSLPPELAAQYAAFREPQRRHDRSFCLDFEPADFTQTYVDRVGAYTQTQHFWWRLSGSGDKVYGCSRPENAVLPFSNSAADITDKIDGLSEENLTAIYQGMKWGVTLLDPRTRPAIDAVAGDLVDPQFAARPHDWDEPNALKVVVLISDGENTWQPRIADSLYESIPAAAPGSPAPEDYWEDVEEPRGWGEQLRVDGGCNQNGTSASRPVWPATNAGCSNSIGQYTFYDGVNTEDAGGGAISLGDARLYEICHAARGKGVVVYTIGFDVNATAQRALNECAGAGRAFIADGKDLRQKFDVIAADISNLRLMN